MTEEKALDTKPSEINIHETSVRPLIIEESKLETTHENNIQSPKLQLGSFEESQTLQHPSSIQPTTVTETNIIVSWYYHYVHYWIRIPLVLLLCLYIFAISSNITTHSSYLAFKCVNRELPYNKFLMYFHNDNDNFNYHPNGSYTYNRVDKNYMDRNQTFINIISNHDVIFAGDSSHIYAIPFNSYLNHSYYLETNQIGNTQVSNQNNSSYPTTNVAKLTAYDQQKLTFDVKDVQPINCQQGISTIRLPLPDVGFDSISKPSSSSSWHKWNLFTDLSPVASVGLMMICLVLRKDMIRFAEMIWIECILILGKGVLQVLTVVPDANLSQTTCNNSSFENMGSWIFTRITSDFCGIMVYSGHFFHTILGFIMIRRMMWDWIGWHPLCYKYSHPFTKTMIFLFRILTFIWCCLVAFSLIKTRNHYSIDVAAAAWITCLVMTHQTLIQWGVRFLYPIKYEVKYPTYSFKDHPHPHPMQNILPKLPFQLTEEERVGLVGVGGLF